MFLTSHDNIYTEWASLVLIQRPQTNTGGQSEATPGTRLWWAGNEAEG